MKTDLSKGLPLYVPNPVAPITGMLTMFSKQPYGASLLTLSLCYYCIAYSNTLQLCPVKNLFKSDYPRRKKKSLIVTVSRSAELRRTLSESLSGHCLTNWLFRFAPQPRYPSPPFRRMGNSAKFVKAMKQLGITVWKKP